MSHVLEHDRLHLIIKFSITTSFATYRAQLYRLVQELEGVKTYHVFSHSNFQDTSGGMYSSAVITSVDYSVYISEEEYKQAETIFIKKAKELHYNRLVKLMEEGLV